MSLRKYRMPEFASRMYVRIYLTLLACLVVAATLFAFLHLFVEPARHVGSFPSMEQVVRASVPPAGAAPQDYHRALAALRRQLKSDLAIYDGEGRQLGAVGSTLPGPDMAMQGSGIMPSQPSIYAFRLPEGRWLLAQRTYQHGAGTAMMILLAMIALVVAVGAYPVVRRITRGLERLQHSLQAWGQGDLTARVPVVGRDEVAQLAASFNESAARIEALVQAQKTLLANASHELRSPLARIRMAVELMQSGTPSQALRQELARNIGELDQLIDEVLLASRLDMLADEPIADDDVDLAGISAEECARAGAQFEGSATLLRGDARLLRRMVRNLLENAQRHGSGAEVLVRLASAQDQASLEVCDRGPGIPESEREQIFAPFYRLVGASEKAGGVGLGLSLVRQIARRHGGDVECLPNGGGGACFRVRLPASR